MSDGSNVDVEGHVSMEESELKGEQEGEKEQRDVVMFVRTLQELSRGMEAFEEHKVQEDQNETSMATEKECMCHIFIVHCYILDSICNIYHLSFDTKFISIFK